MGALQVLAYRGGDTCSWCFAVEDAEGWDTSKVQVRITHLWPWTTRSPSHLPISEHEEVHADVPFNIVEDLARGSHTRGARFLDAGACLAVEHHGWTVATRRRPRKCREEFCDAIT